MTERVEPVVERQVLAGGGPAPVVGPESLHDDALFRLLVESVEEYAIFMLDRNGVVRTWNPGAQRIKGYAASEIIGQHFGKFYPETTPRERLDAELAEAASTGIFAEEGWRVRKNGERFWASVVITPLRSATGQLLGFAKVTRDMTDRRRHEEERAELLAKEAEARAETAARDAFLSIAAHELKTPMTSTRIAAQLLKRSFAARDDLDASQRRSLDVIDAQVEKLSQLVTRLLETVRIQGDRLELYREPVDLAALVRSWCGTLQQSVTQRLLLTTPPEVRANIDPLRIEQVFSNLVGNAAKFGPTDKPIRISVESDGGWIELAVLDHGPGIPPAERDRLFQRFFQANPDRSGLGLGLFISRQIAEAHGGTLEASFPPAGGALFTLRLPA